MNKYGQVIKLKIMTVNCLNKIKQKYNGKIVIFDIGFNIGQYSLMLSNLIFDNKNYIIYGFEPIKEIFEYSGGITETDLNDKNIFLFNLAVGEKKEKKEILIPYCIYGKYKETGNIKKDLESNKRAPDGGAYGISTLSDYKKNVIIDTLVKKNKFKIKTQIVNVISLDNFCSINGVNDIHFIKIDVENYTKEIFNGAINLFTNKKIYGGVTEKCISFSNFEIQDFLLKYGYSIINEEMHVVDRKYLENDKRTDHFFLRLDLI